MIEKRHLPKHPAGADALDRNAIDDDIDRAFADDVHHVGLISGAKDCLPRGEVRGVLGVDEEVGCRGLRRRHVLLRAMAG
jgi:hypothetical protein